MAQQQAKPQIVAAFGRRGSGKTAWLKLTFLDPKFPRLALWDFKHDPALDGIGRAYSDLPAFVRALRAETFQLRYQVDHSEKRLTVAQQFEIFCLACFEAGCLRMYVAELPEVTKASKAPTAWRRCINVGRDYRDARGVRKWLAIAADAQRPAEVDKSFISNCDVVHTGALMNAADARALADTLGCDFRELLQLPDLHYIERDTSKPEPVRDCLPFAKKPQKKPTAPAAKRPRAASLRNAP